MVDWNDIKNAFERDLNKQEETLLENEKKLLKAVASYLSSEKGMTPLQGYKPEEVAEFLEKPIPEIKNLLGGEWADTEDSKLDTIIYTLIKKVKISNSLMPW